MEGQLNFVGPESSTNNTIYVKASAIITILKANLPVPMQNKYTMFYGTLLYNFFESILDMNKFNCDIVFKINGLKINNYTMLKASIVPYNLQITH